MTDAHTPATETSAGGGSMIQPALLGGILVLLLAIVLSDIWISKEFSDDAALVTRSLEVQNRITALALEIRRAESSQRGYLLSENPEYLEDYRRYAANVPRMLAEVKSSEFGIERRQKQLERLVPQIDRRLAELNETMSMASAGRFEEAKTIMRSGEGRAIMNEVAVALAEMRASEDRLLGERRDVTAATNNLSLIITLVGAALIVAFGTASIVLLRRSMRQRDKARLALKTANDNLETKIEERTAELREANNEIQRFAYIVSHDLRSPLVNIMGFTAEVESIKKDIFDRLSGMQENDTDDARKTVELSRDFDESLAFIKTSIGKMDRLINSILKLSREGQRSFKPEYVSMDQLVKSITDAVAHQAVENDIEISVEPLPPLKSDRLALEQIFSNLIDNAMKYTKPDRPGLVRVRGRVDDSQVVYEVEDNGRGIAPEDHQRVFDLFRRAGEQDQKGEGIGLAHTRALVRRLGGYMALKSALGEGSTFIVTLPRRMQDDERQAA
jgi:signal transduction histidine kinase